MPRPEAEYQPLRCSLDSAVLDEKVAARSCFASTRLKASRPALFGPQGASARVTSKAGRAA
jgi:hypothetical protein